MTATTRRTYPPITCRPWCIDGDGHADEHPEDQRCASGWETVPLALNRKWSDSGGALHTTEIEVRSEAGEEPAGCPPHVVIYEVSEDIEWRLYPDEVRRLAALLVEAADRLEAAR